MPKNTTFFYKNLITWYLQNKRALPWRKTQDPYLIWLSEIILQQTRVAQGLPYYEAFKANFPTVYDLAATEEETVLKLWQGLGYYSRARNLHSTAKMIASQYDGRFPNNYEELLTLKGVGDYTASAIASICFNEPAAVVDGNVYRVLSRVFGIGTPINSSAGIKEFKKLAQHLIDETQPGTYNQAIMEFGARYCVPQNPKCDGCIFNQKCEALAANRVNELPVKLKKTKIKKHYFNYIVPISETHTFLKQRTQKGIWQQLYEFPLVESPSEVDQVQLQLLPAFQLEARRYGIKSLVRYNSEEIVHKLSHKHLYTTFWIAQVDAIVNGISFNVVHDYPVPILLGNFISEFPPFNH